MRRYSCYGRALRSKASRVCCSAGSATSWKPEMRKKKKSTHGDQKATSSPPDSCSNQFTHCYIVNIVCIFLLQVFAYLWCTCLSCVLMYAEFVFFVIGSYDTCRKLFEYISGVLPRSYSYFAGSLFALSFTLFSFPSLFEVSITKCSGLP